MTEKELANFLLDKLSDLERVEFAADRDKEIAYQKKFLEEKKKSKEKKIMNENVLKNASKDKRKSNFKIKV